MKKLLLITMTALTLGASAKTYRMLIGTYTANTGSKGIYTYAFDAQKRTLTKVSEVGDVTNPSYLAFGQRNKYLYAVNENGAQSAVTSFRFEQQSGRLVKINEVKTQGADPCFLAVNRNILATANYSGGNISVLKIKDNGGLDEDVQLIQQPGSSVHPTRQKESHVHQVVFSPNADYLLTANLGTDFISSYRSDKNGGFILEDRIQVKPGSGPRHMVFSADGNFIYLVHEIDGTISVLSFHQGHFQVMQEETLVRKTGIESGAADIHLSPDGKFLYATNRGTANDITCFKIQSDGKLTFVSQLSCGGVGPRNFAISPDGRYVFIANQRTNKVVVFERNSSTGNLTETAITADIAAPVCVLFY